MRIKRKGNLAGSALHGHAHRQLSVDVVGVATTSAAAGTKREHPHRFAVDRQLQSVLLGCIRRARHLDLDLVLSVLREQVTDDGAAAGAERETVQPVVLLGIRRHAIGRSASRRRRAAGSQSGNGPGGRQVALHQRLRKLQNTGDVVESVARIVGGQKIRDVDFETKRVTHGVPVLGPVQSVECLGATRIRPALERPIELSGKRGHKRALRRVVGTRPARRGHQPRAQLADHLLPGLGLKLDLPLVEHIEREVARPGSLVVAADAVSIEQRPLLRPRTGWRGLRRARQRLRHRRADLRLPCAGGRTGSCGHGDQRKGHDSDTRKTHRADPADSQASATSSCSSWCPRAAPRRARPSADPPCRNCPRGTRIHTEGPRFGSWAPEPSRVWSTSLDH